MPPLKNDDTNTDTYNFIRLKTFNQTVLYDMEKAISGLDGKEYGFELQIEGEGDTSDNG